MTGLLGSTVLEVAIGVAFVYLLLAIFCTTANEFVAAIFKTRGALLQQGILQLLVPDQTSSAAAAQDPVAVSFYNHPLIKALMRDREHPSYLPARTFAKTIMDLATPGNPGSITFEQLENGIKTDLPQGTLRTTLLAVIQSTDRHIEDAQRAIEAWYDDAMDRVSGWYKRRTQLWTVIFAAIVTVATNADTLHIAQRLWLEPVLRSQLVESSRNAPAPGMPSITQNGAQSADQAAAALGSVLGWQAIDPSTTARWTERLIGWLLTILAVSLGAPFWFDVLNKFMNLRSSGKSPDETGKPPAKAKMPPVTA